MSGKKRRDYKAVLDAVISISPSPPRVTKVMLDFERAVWSALRQTLPGVQLKGCSFHWTQALWRKVQGLELQDAYRNDCGTHQLIKQLMALSYLPADKIERRFRRLQQQATVRPLQDFCSYIDENWIISQTFPPQNWSVFQEVVRTNNDLEGWHSGMNRRAKG